MRYCFSCDRNLDTDYIEFVDDVCIECYIELNFTGGLKK